MKSIEELKLEHLEGLKQIEKVLQVLEIIRKHKLLNYILKNKKCANMYHLTCEELELLKEVFKEED